MPEFAVAPQCLITAPRRAPFEQFERIRQRIGRGDADVGRLETVLNGVYDNMTVIGHETIGNEAIPLAIQRVELVRDDLRDFLFRQPAWTFLHTAVEPRVEMSEVFFVQFVEFIPQLRAAEFNVDGFSLTLTPFLQFLNDMQRQGVRQPKGDEVHHPFGLPVREFTAVEVGHRDIVNRNLFRLIAEMNFELPANLTHTALGTSRDSGEHVVMFGFARDGLLKKFFERFSASRGVAQGYFSGDDQTRAQASIGCQAQAVAILAEVFTQWRDESNRAKRAWDAIRPRGTVALRGGRRLQVEG